MPTLAACFFSDASPHNHCVTLPIKLTGLTAQTCAFSKFCRTRGSRGRRARMALKPQLLAGVFVALIASTTNAQQLGPWTGPPAGSGSPIVYATAQAPFAAPTGDSMAYNPAAPPFAQTGMGPQPGEMQLVSSTYSAPVGEPVPANPAGVPTDPNATIRYLDSANAMYGQNGPPGPNNGMVYGPGPVAPPGYPAMQSPGPAPYGDFPVPQPVTPRWYVAPRRFGSFAARRTIAI